MTGTGTGTWTGLGTVPGPVTGPVPGPETFSAHSFMHLVKTLVNFPNSLEMLSHIKILTYYIQNP